MNKVVLVYFVSVLVMVGIVMIVVNVVVELDIIGLNIGKNNVYEVVSVYDVI